MGRGELVVLSVLPLWMRVVMHLLTLGLALVFVVMALAEGGLVGVGAGLAALACAAGWVVVLRWSTTRARTSFPAEGSVSASPVVSAALATALSALIGAAVVWGVVLLDDPGALPNPGFVLWVVLGALGCLPTAVRVLSGRYHRWALDLGPESLDYRGGARTASLPWPAVGDVVVSPHRTQVELRPAEDGGPPVLVSSLLLESDAETLRDHLEAVRSRRG